MIKSRVPIHCILAVDINNGISKDGEIPWRISEDFKYFKNITTSIDIVKTNVVIMGKNTWESIGCKPLSKRINIIISTTMKESHDFTLLDKNIETCDMSDLCQLIKFLDDNLIVCSSIEKAIKYVNKRNDENNNINDIFICGGKQLYDFFLNNPTTDKVYMTKINNNYQTNTIINFTENNFSIISSDVKVQRDAKNDKNVEIVYYVYQRIKNNEEQQYLDILRKIITEGNFRPTRNANTYSLFSNSMTFDLSKSFPLLTTKKMFLKGIFEELKFFLLGKTNSKLLEEKKVNIWKGNTNRQFLDFLGLNHYNEGDMGPMYGFQWRHYGIEYKGCDHNYKMNGYDQLQNVINLLKTDKYSRRIMMTTFNPSQLKESVLAPCHGIVVQFGVEGSNKLSCHMYQR